MASERTTPPEQVDYIQAIRTDMMKLEAQVKTCEGTSQRVVVDAMHDMLEQLESIRKDSSLVEMKSEEERQSFREEIEELQTDLGIVKRTMKNLPTQVQWNTETVKNLLGSFSTLERELDAKFAEYDSFIASQKEFNQDISFQVASNSQQLNDLEEALAKESNSPTAARLDELENKLNSIAAEGTPTIVAIATAVNDEHGAEPVTQLKNRITILEDRIRQQRFSIVETTPPVIATATAMNDEHEAEQVDQIQPSENQIKRDDKGKEQELDIYVQNTTISNNTQFDKNNDTGPVIYDEVASLLFGTTLTRIDWVAAQELLNSSTHEDALLTGFKALLVHPKAFQNRALRKSLLESLHSWKFAEGLGLSAKCDDGNKWAQYVKGRLSDEVLRDYETAAHFYELAADQGNAAAQVGLGCLYEEGHGVTQDYTKARHFYELAAEQGYAGAQNNIGNLYREGLGVTQDYAKARHFYELSAEQGHGLAQKHLGSLYEEGLGVTKDYAKARHCYERAADQGDTVAQTNLGYLYLNGHGIAQDYTKERHFYELAAEQGSADAQSNLGNLYANGLGVTQDYAKARHFYQLAAEQASADAQYNLGVLFDVGKGGSVNKEKARHYYGLEAAQDHADAQRRLLGLPKRAPTSFSVFRRRKRRDESSVQAHE